MEEYVLKTESLSKVYGARRVIDGVNMSVKRGDIYGFVGENGAGKTTLIRMITGLGAPTSGRIELFGEDVKTAFKGTRKGRIAAVVESPSLYLSSTAMENLILEGGLIGVTDKRVMMETLDRVGLSAVIYDNKKVKNFSLGMRGRLGLAVALLGNPEFIVLDEPMNGLDPEGIMAMRELIKRLNGEGMTFLISSHILSELQKIANVYGFIHRGRLIEEITKAELDAKCVSFAEFRVSDVNKTVNIFAAHGFNAFRVENDKIVLLKQVKLVKVLSLLDSEGVEITNINSENESVENYYFKIIGGADRV